MHVQDNTVRNSTSSMLLDQRFELDVPRTEVNVLVARIVSPPSEERATIIAGKQVYLVLHDEPHMKEK